MGRFAAATSVPVDRTEAEIKAVLRKYNATGFGVWEESGGATIQFAAEGRLIRFGLPLPDRSSEELKFSPARKKELSPDARMKAWEQACRQRWRALLLAIKAKLEAVDCGISEFEQEFLAFVVDPVSKKTVGELMRPALERNYEGKDARPLGLPAPEGMV